MANIILHPWRLASEPMPLELGEKSNRRIVIKSNMMKLYIARNEDGSLALFRKKKPKLFWDEKVGQYWIGSSIWLDSNDYLEVTFENSPMEVELKLIEK